MRSRSTTARPMWGPFRPPSPWRRAWPRTAPRRSRRTTTIPRPASWRRCSSRSRWASRTPARTSAPIPRVARWSIRASSGRGRTPAPGRSRSTVTRTVATTRTGPTTRTVATTRTGATTRTVATTRTGPTRSMGSETGTSPRTTSRTPRRWRLHAAPLRSPHGVAGRPGRLQRLARMRSAMASSRACRPSPAEAPARGRRRGRPARDPRSRARGAVRCGVALAARGRRSRPRPG